jgi:predicted DNA-binding antitoxin AbrB/MazE fold protein
MDKSIVNGLPAAVLIGYDVAMVQIVAATYTNGVFQPDRRPELAERARVRLVVEPIDGNETARREESWKMLQRLWDISTFNSGGERLNRDQLHERR